MGQTDRQTDRRTRDSCIDPAPHTTRTVQINLFKANGHFNHFTVFVANLLCSCLLPENIPLATQLRHWAKWPRWIGCHTYRVMRVGGAWKISGGRSVSSLPSNCKQSTYILILNYMTTGLYTALAKQWPQNALCSFFQINVDKCFCYVGSLDIEKRKYYFLILKDLL